MRYRLMYGLWLVLFAGALAGLMACTRELVLDGGDGPLLLDELDEDAGDSPPDGPRADNYRCLVCHGNYEDEKFAARHARHNVGCEKCHGPSYAHCSDEDNITPPDKMYPRDKGDASCSECHPKADFADNRQHKQFLAGKTTEKYCTDCHGPKHRLAHRTRRWDKSTGKLIYDDKVRMIE